MSYGYGANHAFVLNEERVKELNLPTWEKFYQSVTESEDIISYINDDKTINEYNTLYELEKKVQEEFYDATGLCFEIAYHDCDNNGGCYDDVDGIFFVVYHVKTFTLAGQKAYNDKLITEAWWVTGG